jgi:hypothetical protein
VPHLTAVPVLLVLVVALLLQVPRAVFPCLQVLAVVDSAAASLFQEARPRHRLVVTSRSHPVLDPQAAVMYNSELHNPGTVARVQPSFKPAHLL